MANMAYCALCGGPWRYLDLRFDPESYPRDALRSLQETELDWLEEIRFIGDNPRSSSPCKVWIYEGDDSQSLDPNHPDYAYKMYSVQLGEPWAAIFHSSCRQIFSRYMGVPVSDLNKESLFETLHSFRKDGPAETCLGIDYGDINFDMGRDPWTNRRGNEHIIFNPVQVNGLHQLYTNLPRRPPETGRDTRLHRPRRDPFSALPPEILSHIMLYFDISTIFTLRRASTVYANMELSSGFWKARLRNDMPWLWDFPADALSDMSDEIDWRRAYHKLYWGSRYDSSNKNKIYGLCNRRRIWEEMCPIFVEPYQEYESRRRALGFVTPESLYRSFSADPTQLVHPAPNQLQIRSETLIDQLNDIPVARVSLRFDWSEQGFLLAIRVLKDGMLDAFTETLKQPANVTKSDTVPIPVGEWLMGFVFSTRRSDKNYEERQIYGVSILFGNQLPVEVGDCEGDKCLFYAAENWFIVGLRTECLEDGSLCRLSLAQKALPYAFGCTRVQDTLKSNYCTWPTQVLWRNQLPSPASRYSTLTIPDEYIALELRDGKPIDLLIFATSEEELADITSISIDSQIGGFEVAYATRAIRSIGPRGKDMSTLIINGCEGERITKISVRRSRLQAIRIATNWDRCLEVGDDETSEAFIDLIIKDSDDDMAVQLRPCGIFAQWFDNELKGVAAHGLPTLPLSCLS